MLWLDSCFELLFSANSVLYRPTSASAETWLNTLPHSLHHQDLHLPQCQEVLHHCQDDQPEGQDGMEWKQTGPGEPAPEESEKTTCWPGPQLLSCDWPGLSQSPPLEPPAGLACCQGMWDNQLQGEVEVTLMKEMQNALMAA